MMSRTFAVLALTAASSLFVSPSADAQVVGGRLFGGPRTFVGPGGPVALTPGYGDSAGYSSAYAAPASTPGYVVPYSYYVLPPNVPSRIYVGPAEFPFYGRPYGHPSDRWTWPYLTGPNYGVLARYFYPPLG